MLVEVFALIHYWLANCLLAAVVSLSNLPSSLQETFLIFLVEEVVLIEIPFDVVVYSFVIVVPVEFIGALDCLDFPKGN